jgi:hypothetical protein
METFARLRDATLLAQEQNELPDFLATRLLTIVDHPKQFPDAEAEIQALLEMLLLYDTYGQIGYIGYIGMGVSNLILEGALSRLEKKRR